MPANQCVNICKLDDYGWQNVLIKNTFRWWFWKICISYIGILANKQWNRYLNFSLRTKLQKSDMFQTCSRYVPDSHNFSGGTLNRTTIFWVDVYGTVALSLTAHPDRSNPWASIIAYMEEDIYTIYREVVPTDTAVGKLKRQYTFDFEFDTQPLIKILTPSHRIKILIS